MTPTGHALLRVQRDGFLAAVSQRLLYVDSAGVPSNADKSSPTSVGLASELAKRIGGTSVAVRLAGQTSGKSFEEICAEFLRNTFLKIQHLRPGKFTIQRGAGGIQEFDQYSHLQRLSGFARANPDLAAAMGRDYQVGPDLVIYREPESDAEINALEPIVDVGVSERARLRQSAGGEPLLHACVSCKWTIRSDRAQNVRTEALNLIRNRKGPLPHIVAVTGEPLPSRIASIALGTGDVDCVYHIALPELLDSAKALPYNDALELLETMVDGRRLRDISDLPLDLAI